MNIDYQGGESHLEKLDADAVCIQCGTVNAEGTLLCKVCGNNLRDQRNRRLATDQVLELGPSSPKYRTWLSPIMFILAVGLILSTLYNQDMIVEWIMDSQVSGQSGVEAMWRGPEAETINALASDLEANAPTQEIADSARLNPLAAASLDGLYALFVDDLFVGSANVSQEGDDVYFAALLHTGDEVRGHATLQGNYYILVPNSGGLKERNRFNAIQGVASPQGNGIVECVGDNGRTRYSCLAYHLGTP